MDSTGGTASSMTASFDMTIRQPTEAAVTFAKLADPLRCKHVKIRVATVKTVTRHGRTRRVRGRSRTKKVLRCNARTVRRTVTVIEHQHGRTLTVKKRERVVLLPHTVDKPTLRVAHGTGATVSGILLLAGGTPLAGQPITVLAAPDNGLGQFAPVASATTSANGTWSADLPAGPSRLIEAAYGGTTTTEPAGSNTVKLDVPAKIKLLSVTRRVAWGGTVKIVGELDGGYLPPGGALVRLEIGQGKSVTTYGVKEHVTSSRFTTEYRFGQGDPSDHVRFWFRIASLPESSYPFTASASGRRYVDVGGHQ